MKILSRLILVGGLIAGMVAAALPQPAAAAYPDHTITWVVPFSAGGGTDRWARILSSSAIDVFGQAFHVRNIPGASGVVGWKQVLERPADGYNIIQSSSTSVLALLMEEKPPIQPDQIKIVGYISSFSAILAAQPGKAWSTWKGLVAYGKKNPGKLTIGGTLSNQIGAANLFNQAGLKVTYVPYPSTGKAVADFLGGHIKLLGAPNSVVLPLVPDKAVAVVDSGDLPLPKAVAKKFKGIALPKDLGYEGMSFPRWIGVHPDTPDDIANTISDKLGKLMKEKPVRNLIKKIGEEIIWVPRAEAQAKFNKMIVTMGRATKLLK